MSQVLRPRVTVSGNAFQTDFMRHTMRAQTLEEVRNGVIKVIGELRKEHSNVGFVSGIISTDGMIERNIRRLAAYTDYLRKTQPFPLFSCPDVFDSGTDLRVRIGQRPERQWYKFWRDVLSGGITDMFTTPRWEASIGAVDEYHHSLTIGIKVHHVHNDTALIAVLERQMMKELH